MKTKYRHICLEEDPAMPVEEKSTWFCRNNKTKEILGMVTWYGPWKRWVFEGEPGCVFDYTCLRDIADFLENQLGRAPRG